MTHPPSPRIHVIGIAPGASTLAPDAAAVLGDCDLVCGTARHLALVAGFAGEQVDLAAGLGAVIDRLTTASGLRAGILASGDPDFFGVAALVRRRIPRDQVRVWPAVSSMQLAFARAGESWSGARFASLHGRPLENLAPVLGAPAVGVFTDGTNTPAVIARYLADSGWDDLELVVAEDLGLPGERLRRGSVAEFFQWTGSDLNVVLLLRSGPAPRPLGPGLPEEAFSHSRGLITKAEVRAVALGLLRLPRQGVLWDVGAGSGSLGVEACLLAPALRVYAVEKTADGIGHIRENRRRFRTAGLTPVAGTAPGALADLPDPDRVFVGGSGGDLPQILDDCRARLRPGGALVVSAVLTETLADTLTWARERGLPVAFREVSAARSKAVSGRHRLEPQNPVTLVQIKDAAEGETR